MFLWNYEDTSVCIGSIFKAYKNIKSYPDDVQERIGQICSNYLYNGHQRIRTLYTNQAITLLENLDETPHVILYKLIGKYFESYYKKDYTTMQIIKNSIKACGYQTIIDKLPK
ncbi:hypothetical protein [Lactobacillus ultunensis]|uniref:Uncharacterized protein n=1 Tax=Lactobacillus ultunensis DSM 16047 TaxID=525365 RepID=C2EPA8_9LACO|nr:hypothetical protein [Lactobacillus ultunensis]EEJ71603.1 hypothetical protein HMPREF0548_1504 [Lactobacillus ultunensis DSM 16047]KRL82462.1 hypothetical protein FC57_GL001892 [Lactobacillus ultunensis DSM 16047]QQP28415.1 hypothetical protein H4B44_10040 [Lactobacillus ultunensis]